MKNLLRQGRENWLWLLLFFFSLFLLGNNLGQLKKIIVLNQKEKEINQSLSQEMKKNSSLKKRLSYLKTEDFVRQEAREKFGWGEENETIFLIPSPPSSPSLPPPSSPPSWQKWWRLFFY